MYTQFFGLNEKPFSITPDPRYLFLSERHGEGLAHLIYGVTDSGGFIQLTGEVGTGKTTLVRSLLGQLPEEVDVALVLNPQVTVIEFLRNICQELHVTMPADTGSTMALVDALNRYLLDAHARGRRTILMVDEAQNLAEDVLEQLRLLTNLETARQKLLQIILIGQPELREVLAQNHLRQLAQRVTGRYHLEPLDREESRRYIEHRLKVAGALGEIFDAGAKREVYRLSGGVPRLMNVICDRALLGAYSRESRTVGRDLVRRAATEVSGDEGRRRVASPLVAATAAALLLGSVAAVFWLRNEAPPEPGPAPAEAAAVAEAAVAATVPEDEDPQPAADGMRAGSLEDELGSGKLRATESAAMSRLLGLWGVDYAPGRGAACAQARAAGLSCLVQRGTLGMLRQLNRPAMLTLIDAGGNAYHVLLTGLAEAGAMLAHDDGSLLVSVEELDPLWLGQYTLVWRPPAGAPAVIRPGMLNTSVGWLRNSLAALGFDAAATETGADYFDSELERQLRAFQRRHRLDVDGIAGEQTQIMINTLLASDGSPRLAESGGVLSDLNGSG